jgi:sugar phosphate isomerase/epimerase
VQNLYFANANLRQRRERPMAVQTSIQLFTLRESMESDVEGVLGKVAACGFVAVEPYDFVDKASRLASALQAAGLSAPTGHAFLVSPSFVRPDGGATSTAVPDLHSVFEAAASLGMQTVIDPYTAPDAWSKRESIASIAEGLNRAAEVAAEYGLSVGYHNHAHEIEATFDGVTGLELLAERLDPKVVLEVDLYWVARAGADVPSVVSRLGDRVRAVHVKDGTLAPEAIAAYPPADQVPAGRGAVPLAESIDAAGALEYAVIEFDHYEGDIYAAIEESREYLEGRSA